MEAAVEGVSLLSPLDSCRPGPSCPCNLDFQTIHQYILLSVVVEWYYNIIIIPFIPVITLTVHSNKFTLVRLNKHFSSLLSPLVLVIPSS
jgi:hypothetical protein